MVVPQYLTRAGNFTLDANRQIVNADGMFVLSVRWWSIITLDEEVTAFSISQDGTIIAIDQTGLATPTDFSIGVAKVVNPGGLEKVGGNLYRMTPNANPDGELIVGYSSRSRSWYRFNRIWST